MSPDVASLAAPFAAVLDRWHAGDRFGVLCTGDPLLAETVYRSLAPTAARTFGSAESVDAEQLAGLEVDRIVALAWDPADVHPALLRRCTAVLDCGANPDYPRKVVRQPADLLAATVGVLARSGIRDHGLEVAAARLVIGLRDGGCPDPLWVLRSVVADPRRLPTSHHDPNAVGQDPDGDAHDDSPADDEPDQTMESPEQTSSSTEETEATEADPDADRANDGDADKDDPGRDTEATADGDVAAEPASPPGSPSCFDLPDVPEARPATPTGGLTGLVDGMPSSAAAQDSHSGLDAGFGMGDRRMVTVLNTMPSRTTRNATAHQRGRRGAGSPSLGHGPIVRVVPPERVGGRIAAVPTLQRAARRCALGAEQDPTEFRLTRDDLRGAIRRRRGGHHTVIVVDGSSSLARDGLRHAGAAVDQAVTAISARRGAVSVIVAAGQRARVCVERSTSLVRTRQALGSASTGGGTPLSHGLRLAGELLADDELPRRRVILLTDGRPTVGLQGVHLPPTTAADELAQVLGELIRCTPDVTLVPIGSTSPQAEALFAAAGVRIEG